MKKKVSVIIPNWDGEKFLLACLSSLKKQTFKNFEVIVVDNGSSDNSVDLVKKKFPGYKLIQLDKNYGFAKAVNIGIKESLGEYIVLLNNDTKVDKNCLSYLAQAADDHPEVGMVAAKMLNFFDHSLIDSVGDFIDSVGHANNIGFGEKDRKKFSQGGYVFLVTGGGCLIKKEIFETVGFFDEDYFAYFEDVDFCLRAQLLGFKAWFEPKAIIYHIHKATSNRNRGFVEYLQFRNMTMTVIKDFPKSLIKYNFNWLKIFLVNLNTIRFLATQGYLKEALKAEAYILLNLPTLFKKRALIQSSRKVKNAYIIDHVKDKRVTFFGLVKNGI